VPDIQHRRRLELCGEKKFVDLFFNEAHFWLHSSYMCIAAKIPTIDMTIDFDLMFLLSNERTMTYDH